MNKLLYVISSPRGGQSESRAIADEFLDAYRRSDTTVEVDVLDLWTEPLPVYGGEGVAAKMAVFAGQTPSGDQAAAWAEVQRLFARFDAGGEGFGWHEHAHDVHEGCERFFRPGYNAHLIADWLPALDAIVAKLERGALVADVGCGHGASTILIAQAFPNSRFVGSDYHDGSIDTARRRAQEAGVADRVSFERAPAASYSGTDYDLVTMFDCLHDMGDPVGAARHVHSTLRPDGSWMIVEPNAGDRVEDNLNPVGRAYYAFSTLLCTPASLSQDVGLALGAQAGEAQIRNVVEMGGCTGFRRVAETPFNLVFEARR